jgi:Domain of unknown function (DU1801)
MKALDYFYSQQDEPTRGVLLALKSIILQQHFEITSDWKYGMPFFNYKGKRFCYLWVHKKFKQPYIGFVEGEKFEEPYLLKEGRKKMKTMLFNADEDLPIHLIEQILQKAISIL